MKLMLYFTDNFVILLAYLLLPIHSLSGTFASSSCPRKCQCIWRDSKITVVCSDQTLTAIPDDVGKNTQVLNMSGNSIQIFGRAHFSRLGLHNLQKVSCSRCQLESLDSKAFLGLTNLVELDLSANKLTEIPSEALNGEPTALMGLSLKANPIEIVATKAFHRLKFLTKLDLSECSIVSVENGAFEGLESLQRIYLHSNKLVTIRGEDLPPSLHGLSVHDNSWSCDCHLRSFRLWLSKSNVPRQEEPICKGPLRVKGFKIQSLSPTEFACPPQLSPTSMFLTVPKGKNVSIACRVISDPVSQITWYFNGMPLTDEDSSLDLIQGGGGFPRTSERLAEGNLEQAYDNSLSHDGKGQPRVRIFRQDDYVGGNGLGGETKSELQIQQTSFQDNGTYYCQAENKAARVISNFTLLVTGREFYYIDEPIVLHLRFEYLIVAAIAIVVIFVLVLVTFAILFIRACKGRQESCESSSCPDDTVKQESIKFTSGNNQKRNGKRRKVAPTSSNKTPKHIKIVQRCSEMAETTILTHSNVASKSIQPDILTNHSSVKEVCDSPMDPNSYISISQISSFVPTFIPPSNQISISNSLSRPWQNYKVQKASLTTFQPPSAFANPSSLPLMNQQPVVLPLQAETYPEDFGLPKQPLHVNHQKELSQIKTWDRRVVPSTPQQYQMERPHNFTLTLCGRQPNSSQKSTFKERESNLQKYLNSIKCTNNMSKSPSLSPGHLNPDTVLPEKPQNLFHPPNYVHNILFEDKVKNSDVIYESIDHLENTIRTTHSGPDTKKLTLEKKSSPLDNFVTEAEKLDLYGKVIKRKKNLHSASTLATFLDLNSSNRSSSSSASTGSPPPLEILATERAKVFERESPVVNQALERTSNITSTKIPEDQQKNKIISEKASMERGGI